MKKFHLVVQSGCPYCEKAVTLLEHKRRNYTIDPLDHEEPELLLEMKRRWNHSTVPMIWEIDEVGNKRFLGGYSELVSYFLKEDKQLFHG